MRSPRRLQAIFRSDLSVSQSASQKDTPARGLEAWTRDERSKRRCSCLVVTDGKTHPNWTCFHFFSDITNTEFFSVCRYSQKLTFFFFFLTGTDFSPISSVSKGILWGCLWHVIRRHPLCIGTGNRLLSPWSLWGGAVVCDDVPPTDRG